MPIAICTKSILIMTILFLMPGMGLVAGLEQQTVKSVAPAALPTSKYLPNIATQAISPPSKDCSRTSVGFVPVIDMESGQFYPDAEHPDKIDGGLYGNYQNSLPLDHHHMIEAQEQSAQIIPRNVDGDPDENDKIVLVSIGMSNTRTEFSKFMELANADPAKVNEVVFVNGAQISQTAEEWVDPEDESWSKLAATISAAGLAASQVQAVWMKLTRTAPQPDLDAYPVFVNQFRNDMATIAQQVKQRYPNVRVIYLSSRIYAGYSLGALSPEPFAYEGGFSNRLVIEDQINGGGVSGATYENSPVLLWGPYLWADGTTPNTLGLQWDCGDFKDDGVHPSEIGALKVAQSLLNFMKTDFLAAQWFSNFPPPTATPTLTLTPSLTVSPSETLTSTSSPTPTLPPPNLTESPTPQPSFEKSIYLPVVIQ
jgi:hypothetical protein